MHSPHWRIEKILTLEEAAQKSAALRSESLRVVTTNGSFDLLHAGHLDQLEEAKKQGDVLFVGVNADEGVRIAKGPDRPIMSLETRMAMLAALVCVDFVVALEGYATEPHGTFLPALRPNVHVNGADYGDPESWIEWPVMRDLGITPHRAERLNDISTTRIVHSFRSAIDRFT